MSRFVCTVQYSAVRLPKPGARDVSRFPTRRMVSLRPGVTCGHFLRPGTRTWQHQRKRETERDRVVLEALQAHIKTHDIRIEVFACRSVKGCVYFVTSKPPTRSTQSRPLNALNKRFVFCTPQYPAPRPPTPTAATIIIAPGIIVPFGGRNAQTSGDYK